MEQLNNDEIKRKLSNTTVDMDIEMEWGEIELLLDKETDKKMPIFWIIFLSAFVLLIVAGMILYSDNFINDPTIISNERLEEIVNAKNKLETQLSSSEIENEVLKEEVQTIQSTKEISSRRIVDTQQSTTSFSDDEATNDFDDIISIDGINELIFDKSRVTKNLNSKDRILNEQSLSLNDLVNINTKENTENNQGRIHNEIFPLKIYWKELAIKEMALEYPSIKDSEIIKPAPKRRQLLFVASNLSSVNTKIASSINDEYATLLRDNYEVLSKFSVEGGYGLFISEKWQMSLGLKYNQYRSVFRGQVINETSTTEMQDSAQVYTNNVGGNFYTPGNVIINKTEISEIQQYAYMNSLGIGLNTRYYYLGPLYAEGQLSWSPIQWQSGKMLGANNRLGDLKELINQINRVEVALHLGLSATLRERLIIDAGLSYRPNQSLFNIESVSYSANSLGGHLRLSYVLK